MYAIIGIIAVGLSVLVGIASYKFIGLEEDNIIEERAEDVINHYTGQDIDLSPATPEPPPVGKPKRKNIKKL